MAIPRKRILEKIVGLRNGIHYHLNEHIPGLIGKADEDLLEYWRKEVSHLIDGLEKWARRLSKNADILTEASEYRRRLEAILEQRRRQLGI